ncbi:hypothetical protein [Pontibacter qinzhouensis]|uniref:hypothetical protein n=1 Tax=Pontibacter qinzhouensis TaxID=2603253 RepID=UPI00164F842A|nr:hypothetical protein [Pontibacter qinzhouensis]
MQEEAGQHRFAQLDRLAQVIDQLLPNGYASIKRLQVVHQEKAWQLELVQVSNGVGYP